MTLCLWVGPESAFLIGVPDVLMQITNQPILFRWGMVISQFTFASKSSTDLIPQLKRYTIYHTNLTLFYTGLCLVHEKYILNMLEVVAMTRLKLSKHSLLRIHIDPWTSFWISLTYSSRLQRFRQIVNCWEAPNPGNTRGPHNKGLESNGYLTG